MWAATLEQYNVASIAPVTVASASEIRSEGRPGMEMLAAIGWLVAGALAARVFWPGLTEYGKAKGKNLADKEDIAHITDLVEQVKRENAEILEQMKARQQMRLAAATERLKAHQEAFRLWRKLLRDLYRPAITAIVAECDEWWEGNCLYLSAEARDAFSDAMWAAANYQMLLAMPAGPERERLTTEDRATIMKAGQMIVEAVHLPSLGERESRIPEERPS
jgi:hypothetical protein